MEWHERWKWQHTEIYLSAYNRSLPATGKLDNTVYRTFLFQLRHDKNSIFQFCSPNEETAHVENESLDHQSKIRRELPRTFFCSIRVGFAHLYVRTPCACIFSIAAEEVRSEAGKDQYDDLDVEMTCKYGPILCPNNISPSWKTIPISMIWAPWWWKTG